MVDSSVIFLKKVVQLYIFSVPFARVLIRYLGYRLATCIGALFAFAGFACISLEGTGILLLMFSCSCYGKYGFQFVCYNYNLEVILAKTVMFDFYRLRPYGKPVYILFSI